MALAASAAQYSHINGNLAPIHSTNGDPTDDGVEYLWRTKPPTKTGLTRPALVTTAQFDAEGKTIRMLIDSAWPPDESDYGLARKHYPICSGNCSQARQVEVPSVRYCGFALGFDADYEISSLGGGIQSWQGQGVSPRQLRTDENNGNIRRSFYRYPGRIMIRRTLIQCQSSIPPVADPKINLLATPTHES